MSSPAALAQGTLLDVGNSPLEKWPATIPATVTYDPVAKALEFAGTGDFVPFGPTNFGSPFTVIAMVRPDSIAGTVRVVDFYGGGGGAAPTTARLSMSISAASPGAGAVQVFSAAGAVSASFTTAPGNPLWSVGTWCHVAFTLGGSSALGSLYLNGAVVAAGFAFAPMAVETRMGYLGRGPGTGTVAGENYFQGAISDFQVSG